MAAAELARPLDALDWQAPWLAEFKPLADRVLAAQAGGMSLHDALNAQGDCPVRFVPQSALPADMAYEAFIAQSGLVPTRDNLHDALNALAWLRFPRTKAMLNHLQMREISARGVGAARGPVRDAITVFDENGAVLSGSAAPAVAQALSEHRWLDALHTCRSAWVTRDVQLTIFGHALLEKLQAPRMNMVAHVFVVPQFDCHPVRDELLADALRPAMEALNQSAARKSFSPLPVFGVPLWHADNADASFYCDASVFRPRRTPSANAVAIAQGLV